MPSAVSAQTWRQQQRRRRVRRQKQLQRKREQEKERRRRNKAGEEATPKQLVLLSAIAEAHKATGFPPTLRELQETLQLKSLTTVVERLGVLEDRGWLTRLAGTARGLVLTEQGTSMLLKRPLQQWKEEQRVEAAQLALIVEEENERYEREQRESQQQQKQREQRKRRRQQEQDARLEQHVLPGMCAREADAA